MPKSRLQLEICASMDRPDPTHRDPMLRTDSTGLSLRFNSALLVAALTLSGASASTPQDRVDAQAVRSVADDDRQPQIIVDPAQVSFQAPIRRQGEPLSHRFTFTTGGGSPLVIQRAIANCGCLDPVLSYRTAGSDGFQVYGIGEPIPSGSEVALDMAVDTLLKQDRSKLTVQLITNASDVPTTFELIADVEPRFRVTPPGLIFGDLRPGETRTGEIDIISTTGKPVRFVQDEATRLPLPAGMSFLLEPVRPMSDGRATHWKLRIQLGLGMKEGPGGYRFLLVSDDQMPETPLLRKRREAAKARGRAFGAASRNFSVNILTNFRILGDLEISPGVVSFGQLRAGQSYTQRVKLVATKPGIDLSKARAYIRGALGLEVPLADQMSVKTQPVEGENALWADVKISGVPAGFRGTIRCELVFETGYDEKPLVRVPIIGVVP